MVALTFATYGGLPVLGVDFLLTPGAEPSTAVLTMVPEEQAYVPPVGELALISPGATLLFSSCAVVNHQLYVSRNRRPITVWFVVVQDRRWKWKYTTISGMYNRRLSNGEPDVLQSGSPIPLHVGYAARKNARSLAELLLEAMGESDVDVSQLPDDIYPYVDWEYANPAVELEKLCASCGRIMMLGTDDALHIVALGQPGDVGEGSFTNLERSYTRGNVPSRITVVGGKTILQADYTLLPVSFDTDLAVKASWNVSYLQNMPSVDPLNQDWITDPTARSLSYSTTCRTYRPIFYAAWDVDGIDADPSRKVRLSNVDQILPILDHLCTPVVWSTQFSISGYSIGGYETDNHMRDHVPHVGTGTNYGWDLTRANAHYRTNYQGADYEHLPDFTLDHATGLVRMAMPMCGLGYTASLRCAHHVRDRDTGAHLRYHKSIDVPGGGAGEETVRDESLVLAVARISHRNDEGTWTEVISNRSNVEAMADTILAECLRKYTETSQDMSFVGFVGVQPNAHVVSIHFQMRVNDAAFTAVRYRVAAQTAS